MPLNNHNPAAVPLPDQMHADVAGGRPGPAAIRRPDQTTLSGELAEYVASGKVDPAAGQRTAFLLAGTAIWDLLKKIAPQEGLEEKVLVKILAFIMKMSSTYTYEHSWRVGQYARQLAMAYGLEEEEQQQVADAAFFRDLGLGEHFLSSLEPEGRERLAEYLRHMDSTLQACATLHDVGKIEIPLEILHKPTSLTDDEYEIIKRHPLIGEELLKRIPSLVPAALGVRHHHERWDGDGYPDGLAGTEIPLAARIVAIVDAFDAMISKRPYKPAYPLDQALAELEANAGSQFDPNLIRMFVIQRRAAGMVEMTVEDDDNYPDEETEI